MILRPWMYVLIGTLYATILFWHPGSVWHWWDDVLFSVGAILCFGLAFEKQDKK